MFNIMAIWVWSFQTGGYEIRQIFAYHTLRNFLNLENWTNGKPRGVKIINFKNSDFCKLMRLPISPKFKIQKFPFGMLILRQKSYKFCTPRLKTP